MQTTIPTWLAIAVAVVVPLLSALISVGGVLISQKMTNNREAGRRTHERELKEKELQGAKHQRLRDERIKAYLELAAMTSSIDVGEPYSHSELKAALSGIELAADSTEVVNAAQKLLRDACKAIERVEEVVNECGRPEKDKTFRELNEQAASSRLVFVEHAKEDLTQ